MINKMFAPEIHINHLTNVEPSNPVNLPHRDENYVFLFQKTGYQGVVVMRAGVGYTVGHMVMRGMDGYGHVFAKSV